MKTSPPNTNSGRIERLGQLHTTLMCDVRDSLGYRIRQLRRLRRDRHQRMPTRRSCVNAERRRHQAAGRTVLRAAACLQRHMVKRHRRHHAKQRTPIGCLGELLSVAVSKWGVQVMVTDSLVRDVAQLKRMSLPVFARGGTQLDSASRLEMVAHSGQPRFEADDFVLGTRWAPPLRPRMCDEELRQVEERLL